MVSGFLHYLPLNHMYVNQGEYVLKHDVNKAGKSCGEGKFGSYLWLYNLISHIIIHNFNPVVFMGGGKSVYAVLFIFLFDFHSVEFGLHQQGESTLAMYNVGVLQVKGRPCLSLCATRGCSSTKLIGHSTSYCALEKSNTLEYILIFTYHFKIFIYINVPPWFA